MSKLNIQGMTVKRIQFNMERDKIKIHKIKRENPTALPSEPTKEDTNNRG